MIGRTPEVKKEKIALNLTNLRTFLEQPKEYHKLSNKYPIVSLRNVLAVEVIITP